MADCKQCLPLDVLVKVDIGIESLVDEAKFNCITILSSELLGGVGGIASPAVPATPVVDYVTFEAIASEWDANTDVYKAARAVFNQSSSVAQVKVMYLDIAGNVEAQLDELFKCETCQGILFPEYIDGTSDAVAIAIADWVETRDGKNFFFLDSNNVDTKNVNIGTSIAALFAAAKYRFSSVYYHSDATMEFAAAGLSYGLAQDLDLVGSSFTLAYKELVGIDIDYLTIAELTAVTGSLAGVGCSTEYGHFANAYVCFGGIDGMVYGAMADGTFFDTILLREFVAARIQEIMSNIIVSGSVPITDVGLMTAANSLEFVLNNFEQSGFIENYVVEIPSILDTSKVDRACRIIDCFKFTAKLTGRAHTFCVVGQLTF